MSDGPESNPADASSATLKLYASGAEALDHGELNQALRDAEALGKVAEEANQELTLPIGVEPPEESPINVVRCLSMRAQLPKAGDRPEEEVRADVGLCVNWVVANLCDYVLAQLEDRFTDEEGVVDPGLRRTPIRVAITQDMRITRILGGPRSRGDVPEGYWIPQEECTACVLAYVSVWKEAE